MTPQEEAKHIIEIFEEAVYSNLEINSDGRDVDKLVKELSAIHVKGIIKAIDFDWMESQNLERQFVHWDNVLTEIEK